MLKFCCLNLAETGSWFPAATLRVLLSGMLIFAVFFGPYLYAADRHAQHHQSQLFMDHHGGGDHHGQSDSEDHSGVGHALTHCGSAACSPAFVGVPDAPAAFASVFFRTHAWLAEDLDLPSLYLDSDPPVPRGGFSLT
jgi:hypothetical protein